MKTFRFKGDITFEAENIDQALECLAQHFFFLCKKGQESVEIYTSPEEMKFIGSLEVKPIEEKV